MKDWQRSPEPPGMMGPRDDGSLYDHIQGQWGPPEELQYEDPSSATDFDPAAPLPGRRPATFDSASATGGPKTQRVPSRPPMSLYAMTLRVILRNISSVQDLGDMPYRNAKPILEECRIDQLIQLEEASPHLLKDTEEIWRRNCLRDFLELRRKYSPADTTSESSTSQQRHKEPKSWRRLYFRTKGEIEQAKTEAAQRIKDKYAQHKAEKESKRLVVSEKILSRPKNGSWSASSTGRRFGGGSATSLPATKGQSLLNKARNGSLARAKLTQTKNFNAFKVQGRSKAVAAELAPEQQERTMIRPMVAPRKIHAEPTQGLAKLKEFVQPVLENDVGHSLESGTSISTSAPVTTPDARTKAANSVTSARNEASSSNGGSVGPLNPSTAKIPAPPPPDISKVERRKLDFFGRKPGGNTVTVSTRPAATTTIHSGDVRGTKRSLSSSNVAASASSSPSSSSNPASHSDIVVTKSKRAARQKPDSSSPAARYSPLNGGEKEHAIVINDDDDRVDQEEAVDERRYSKSQRSASRSVPSTSSLPAQQQPTAAAATAPATVSPIRTHFQPPSTSVTRLSLSTTPSYTTASNHSQASAASLSSIFVPASSRRGKSATPVNAAASAAAAAGRRQTSNPLGSSSPSSSQAARTGFPQNGVRARQHP